MPEIKCPECGKVFTVDQSDYDKIASQVRDQELHRLLEKREESLKVQHDAELKNVKMQVEQEYTKEISDRNSKIQQLENDLKNQEREIKLEADKELNEKLRDKDIKIQELENDLKNQEREIKNKAQEEINAKQAEIDRAKSELANQKAELNNAHKEEIINLNEAHKAEIEEIKSKNAEKESKLNDEITQLRQYRQSRSVKDIGEDLEQYCKNEFEKVRQIGFKNAQFGKDNDATSGSKGDFIFRDFTDDGIEIVSIMFDMKDERDESANKHKNEDFLDKLDKDRKTKKCEYAILVSTLEKDNDLFNEGIVDVSHLHDKMYVIRPQFFIPMITLLRNAALTTIDEKRQNIIIKQENMDAATFQNNMQTFIDGFNETFKQAKNRHWDAINEIDKIIDHLKAMRKALTASDKHLNTAKNKVIKNATVKNLTKNAPSVANELSGVSLQIPSFDSPEDNAKVDRESDEDGDK